MTTVPQQEMKPLNRRAIAMKNDYGPVLYLDVVLALNFSCLNLSVRDCCVFSIHEFRVKINQFVVFIWQCRKNDCARSY